MQHQMLETMDEELVLGVVIELRMGNQIDRKESCPEVCLAMKFRIVPKASASTTSPSGGISCEEAQTICRTRHFISAESVVIPFLCDR